MKWNQCYLNSSGRHGLIISLPDARNRNQQTVGHLLELPNLEYFVVQKLKIDDIIRFNGI